VDGARKVVRGTVTSEAREPLPETQEQLVGPAVVAAPPLDPVGGQARADGVPSGLPVPEGAAAGDRSGGAVGVQRELDDGQPEGGQPDGAGQPEGGQLDGAGLGLGRNTSVLLVSGFATVLLAALAALLPVPYAALKPGPAINTLGSQNGKQLISVTGHQTYPATGTLDLTTVTVVGGPGGKLTVADLIVGVLDPSVAIVPEEEVFPTGQTQQQNQQQNQQEMATSQEEATAAALGELGITVPATLTISEVVAGAPAAAVLRHGDVLLAIDGVATGDLASVRTELQKVKAGEPVTVTVRRDGKEQKLVARTRAADGRTVLGILIDPSFHFPFTVKIQIDDVGGPSAGMMFALGIIDVLTPGSMTGGRHIAGTGTIDSDGVVGAIGGIQEKMIGARRAGATWFLAPAEDCPEVVGHVPDGLRVVRVSTLHEARQAVNAVASGNGSGLPTCTK
jgi:PDZ domain-containing protein